MPLSEEHVHLIRFSIGYFFKMSMAALFIWEETWFALNDYNWRSLVLVFLSD
jgi:hypothetical protein